MQHQYAKTGRATERDHRPWVAEPVREICPTSNLLTKADEEELRDTIRAFVEHDVPFTIATDGPEMMRTRLRDEFELLLRIGALDGNGLREANARGHHAPVVRGLTARVIY